jgi:hypothetical protein
MLCMGVCLSTFHQSSLGNLMVIAPYKLHHLWWSPLSPLLFPAVGDDGGAADGDLHHPLRLMVAEPARRKWETLAPLGTPIRAGVHSDLRGDEDRLT